MTWDDGDQEEFEAEREEHLLRRAEAAEARVMELEQRLDWNYRRISALRDAVFYYVRTCSHEPCDCLIGRTALLADDEKEITSP